MKEGLLRFICAVCGAALICSLVLCGCTRPSDPGSGASGAPNVSAVYNYDISYPEDVRVDVDLNGAAIASLKEGNSELASGSDYTYADTAILIDASYFTGREEGDVLKFTVATAGGTAAFTVKVIKSQAVISAPEPEEPVTEQLRGEFDLNRVQDLRVPVDLRGEAILSLSCGEQELEGGADYTYADTVIVLYKEWLMNFEEGERLTFTFETPGGSASFSVDVVRSDPSDMTISLSQTEVSLTVGGPSASVTAQPSDGISVVTWSNSNPAAVDMQVNGNTVVLTGVSAGSATIAASLGEVRTRADVSVEMVYSHEYDIELDADLSDWEALDGYQPHTLSMNGYGGEGDTISEDDHKSATFYAVLAEDGLYAAVEVYHDLYANDAEISYAEPWWYNAQFEIFVGEKGAKHYFIYASDRDLPYPGSLTGFSLGMDNGFTGAQAYWVTQENGGDGNSRYKTVVEVFIPLVEFSDYVFGGAVRVGVAWKSKDSGDEYDTFDECGNGSMNGGAPDKLWIPQGASTNTEYMPVVDENGIWIVDEYWS